MKTIMEEERSRRRKAAVKSRPRGKENVNAEVDAEAEKVPLAVKTRGLVEEPYRLGQNHPKSLAEFLKQEARKKMAEMKQAQSGPEVIEISDNEDKGTVNEGKSAPIEVLMPAIKFDSAGGLRLPTAKPELQGTPGLKLFQSNSSWNLPQPAPRAAVTTSATLGENRTKSNPSRPRRMSPLPRSPGATPAPKAQGVSAPPAAINSEPVQKRKRVTSSVTNLPCSRPRSPEKQTKFSEQDPEPSSRWPPEQAHESTRRWQSEQGPESTSRWTSRTISRGSEVSRDHRDHREPAWGERSVSRTTPYENEDICPRKVVHSRRDVSDDRHVRRNHLA